ncbi:alpha/beta fold hydrolase [Streptomyces sp. NPDC048254]|uniref:alpha/beta fold hydrolase n=1 Tax=Streptomyces sp. NPDC048254 TaxID=3365525 RepID=UPI00371413D3
MLPARREDPAVGLGERAHLLRPDINLGLHIRDITAVLEYEDLRDVILVGHSYGGMVITGAADRVGHLVYLDAATLLNGVELVLFPETGPMPYCGVTDPGDIAWLQPMLTPHPCQCIEQPLRLENEAELWEIPQTHIVCTATLPGRKPGTHGTGARGGPALGHRHRP